MNTEDPSAQSHASVELRRRFRSIAVILFVVAGSALGSILLFRVQNARQQAEIVKTPAASPSSTATTEGHFQLIVYERDGCKHCVMFEEGVVPKLKEAFGDLLDIERRDAPIDMETPTVIVPGGGGVGDREGGGGHGREDLTFVGVPEPESLIRSIRGSR